MKTLIIVILISIISTVGIEYVRFVNGHELPLIIRGAFPALLIFFCLGIFLRKHSREYSLWLPFTMIILGLIIGIVHMQYIRDTYGISAQGQKVSLYIFDVGFILLCMSKKVEMFYRNNWINRFILFIGEISFGIYFTHVYLIFLCDRYFPHLRDNWLSLWLTSMILTIGIIMATKKIAPAYAKKYLGYR